MFHGLLKLTWLEIKIFMREPLGAIGSIVIPVLVFVVAGRMLGGRVSLNPSPFAGFARVGLPVALELVRSVEGCPHAGTTRSTRTTARAMVAQSEQAFLAIEQRNTPKKPTLKILEYKEMEPFFVKGESAEP